MAGWLDVSEQAGTEGQFVLCKLGTQSSNTSTKCLVQPENQRQLFMDASLPGGKRGQGFYACQFTTYLDYCVTC